MTALPTIAYLRRHALPAHFLDRADAGRSIPRPRPRLAAAWHLNEQGRLVCRWSVVLVAPPMPEPTTA